MPRGRSYLAIGNFCHVPAGFIWASIEVRASPTSSWPRARPAGTRSLLPCPLASVARCASAAVTRLLCRTAHKFMLLIICAAFYATM